MRKKHAEKVQYFATLDYILVPAFKRDSAYTKYKTKIQSVLRVDKNDFPSRIIVAARKLCCN